MRGFPPIQLFILGLAFALLAVPLTHLTSPTVHAHAQHDDDHDEHGHDSHAHDEGGVSVVQGGMDHPEGEHHHEAVPAWVRIRFAHPPLKLSLKQEGKELLTGATMAASPLELRTEIEISHDGNELMLEATWPPGTPETAVTVLIEPEGFEGLSETRWSAEAQLNEVLTFLW